MNDFRKFLVHLQPAEPAPDLLGKIMKRVAREERVAVLKARIRFVLSSFAAVAAVVFALPLWNQLQNEFAQSGVSQFFSLIFSDLGTVTAYWQDYALSILESLPVSSLAAFFAVVFVFLFAFRYLLHDVKAVFTSHSLPLLKI